MDIQANRIARKYAKAFLNYIGDTIKLSDCEKLQEAIHEFKQHSDYIILLKIPTISAKVKKKGLLLWFQALEISIDITKLLDILTYHQRLFLFPNIMKQLCAVFFDRNNSVAFSIKATVHLKQKQIDSIHTFLEHKTGKHIRSTFVQEKKLIAGLRLQSDIFLWEYSLQQRFRNIVNIV